MGLSRIHACTEIYTRRGQYELSEKTAQVLDKKLGCEGAVVRGQRPHQFYRHETFAYGLVGMSRGQK